MATDTEVANKDPVNKYITLRQLVEQPMVNPDAIKSIATHIDNKANPHNVTKEQVGLGDVSNLPIASNEEFELKADLEKYVLLKQLVTYINKEWVGLKNTPNFKEATLEEAVAGTSERLITADVFKSLLGNVSNLSVATDTEIVDATPANKYITLAQALQLLQLHIPPTPPPIKAPEVSAAKLQYLYGN